MSPERKNACLEIVTKLNSTKDFTESDIEFLCDLPNVNSPSAQFHSVLCKEVLKLKDDPVLSLLEHPMTESGKSFNFLFRAAEYKNNPKVRLLEWNFRMGFRLVDWNGTCDRDSNYAINDYSLFVYTCRQQLN